MKLKRHPESPRSPVESIEVLATRLDNGSLSLAFTIEGKLDGVRLPAGESGERRDELWRHTCVEAFVRPTRGESYVELNFSPGGDWAAYRFDGYRDGMVPADVDAPRVRSSVSSAQLAVDVGVDLGGIGELPREEPWLLSISAVIEGVNGNRSYWALAHPQGRPDFHHRDCFVLELPPAGKT